jgi:mannose-6-phosphate isomerase-like protein (cupin superfamily)
MQQWGIRLIPEPVLSEVERQEKLDMSHYPEEFVEYLKHWPVPFVLIKKDDVIRDDKLRKPGNNGRKVAAIRYEPDPPFSEKIITDPYWKIPYVLPTGDGGLEIATFTEFSGQDRHMHKKSIEIYTVLKGSMEIYLNDKGPFLLAEGEEVLILPGTVHQVCQRTPRRDLPDEKFDLIVRVHATDCYGSSDKYVQLSQNGNWERWSDLSKKDKQKAYKK